MNCKKVIGFNGIGYLIELDDGRHAVLGLECKNVTIEILKETFLKYDSFDEAIPRVKISEINKVLKNPDYIEYGANAQEYLIDENIKQKYEKLRY